MIDLFFHSRFLLVVFGYDGLHLMFLLVEEGLEGLDLLEVLLGLGGG